MRRDRQTFPLLFLALLLMLVGAILPEYDDTQRYLRRVFLLAGLAGVAWALFQSGPSLRFLFGRMRTVSEPGPAVNWTLLGGLLLAGAVALSIQEVRYDVTEKRLNSLSPTSREALQTLTQDVEMIAAYRANSPASGRAQQLLQLYAQASGRIETRSFDPDRRPEEARRLGLTRPDVILVRTDVTREVIADLREPDLTQALLRVEDTRRPVAGMVVGHGEMAPERPGFTRFRKLLADAGFQFRTVSLAELADVPDDIGILLIAGPTVPLLPGEQEAVERFLDRGGRIGVFVDPGSKTGLEARLRRRGIVIDGRRVRDESQLTRSLDLGPETLGLNQLGDHPVTRGLAVGVALNGATRVALTDEPVFGTNGTDLLRTGRGAYLLEPTTEIDASTLIPPELQAARGDSPEDSVRYVESLRELDAQREGGVRPATEPGVVSVAAALEWEGVSAHARPSTGHSVPEKPYSRIVAVGDSDFLRDGMIDLFGNREFAARIVGWLSEREFLLRFPPVDRGSPPLEVNQAGLKAVDYLLGLFVPFSIYALGLFFWMRRR